MGTRGDIQPYIYLAQALNESGHAAMIGSHPCWRDLVEQAGVGFRSIGPDIDIEAEAAKIRGKQRNPALSMLNTMNFIFRTIQNATADILAACEGVDLVIVSHSQMGATEAEVLNIPKVHVSLQTEMIPETGKPVGVFTRIVGSLIGKFAARPFNKIRGRYQLPPLRSSAEILGENLNLIPISRWVKERSPYWSPQHHLTGYWYRDAVGYVPDPALASFLAAGDPPLILALGAMAFESEKEERKLCQFLTAFEQTGTRAIIQGFQKTLAGLSLPDTMLAAGSVPHSWLFRQGWCVIHHCGFGTASRALISGIPSIPVPHVLDQFGFAQDLERLGVAVAQIKASELSAERIRAAIAEMHRRYPEIKARSIALAEKIQAENGLENAVRLIEGELARISPRDGA